MKNGCPSKQQLCALKPVTTAVESSAWEPWIRLNTRPENTLVKITVGSVAEHPEVQLDASPVRRCYAAVGRTAKEFHYKGQRGVRRSPAQSWVCVDKEITPTLPTDGVSDKGPLQSRAVHLSPVWTGITWGLVKNTVLVPPCLRLWSSKSRVMRKNLHFYKHYSWFWCEWAVDFILRTLI